MLLLCAVWAGFAGHFQLGAAADPRRQCSAQLAQRGDPCRIHNSADAQVKFDSF